MIVSAPVRQQVAFSTKYPETPLTKPYRLDDAGRMDKDFLDSIDLAFREGQIDGETVDLIYLLLADGPFYNPLRETPAYSAT